MVKKGACNPRPKYIYVYNSPRSVLKQDKVLATVAIPYVPKDAGIGTDDVSRRTGDSC